MKRRSVLRSLITFPAVAAAQATVPAQKGLPAGPPLVPPGITETPNTPVVIAGETADGVSLTFTPDQFSALNKLGSLIVPSWNGLPGASEAGAVEFLDFLIGCSPQPRLELYRNGLDNLNRGALQKFARNFAELDSEQAGTLLSPLHQAWEFHAKDNDLLAFLQAAKGDLLRATLNSKPYIGALSQSRRPRNASAFYWYPIG